MQGEDCQGSLCVAVVGLISCHVKREGAEECKILTMNYQQPGSQKSRTDTRILRK